MPTSDESNPLQTLRGVRGWSQEELAQASGVSSRTIQRLETGTPPSLETSRAIAAAFDVDAAEIFPREQDSGSREASRLRGARWGIGGALLGYGCAFVAVTYTFLSGYASGWSAGVTLGTLGAATGIICGAIGWQAHHNDRAA